MVQAVPQLGKMSRLFQFVNVLASDINRIVLWTLLPASAAVFFLMRRWLSAFAYHVSMPLWAFPVEVITVWLVAILSTLGKTLRTAKINPAEVLRTE